MPSNSYITTYSQNFLTSGIHKLPTWGTEEMSKYARAESRIIKVQSRLRNVKGNQGYKVG